MNKAWIFGTVWCEIWHSLGIHFTYKTSFHFSAIKSYHMFYVALLWQKKTFSILWRVRKNKFFLRWNLKVLGMFREFRIYSTIWSVSLTVTSFQVTCNTILNYFVFFMTFSLLVLYIYSNKSKRMLFMAPQTFLRRQRPSWTCAWSPWIGTGPSPAPSLTRSKWTAGIFVQFAILKQETVPNEKVLLWWGMNLHESPTIGVLPNVENSVVHSELKISLRKTFWAPKS